MPRPLCTALAFALPAVACLAQNLQVAGTVIRTSSATYTRGPASMGAGELLQRFDADDLRGFGIEAAFPGVQVVRGVALSIRDFGSSTPNGLFDVTLYTESLSQPGYPDLQAPLGGETGVTANSIPGVFTLVAFPAPALVPIGRDLFVGIRIPATTSSFGGVRLTVIAGSASASTYDLAGTGLPIFPPEENTYRLYRDLTNNAVTFGARGQYQIDLLTSCPSGTPTTISNQASFPLSTAAPGASTLLSGLHPDAASPPLNNGRADDVAFLYGDTGLPLGSLVVFVAAFAPFGAVVPLAQFVPGSIGGACLDQGQAFVLGFRTLASNTQCWYPTTIPAGARPWIRGLAWTQQAIAFDATNGTLRGSQCGRQKY